ncbi:bifunctional glycosyltransferase family 2 protein/CDP-glycerol:glycerophosphate glycerophosphotransferase [Streptomyces sp. NPDC007369]|uniref:bifunctional glycosyltransferase/CDP-glycerol:glycerophosphate glycerophosphotransferase n=1 Tax=Streptomyces sp. NPDC007369 TaxID=3154589 RepID=UPI0033DDCDC1
MPRFSVIVPAYKVQAYLQESLESVLSQSYPDLELIAVDDASPDACGALIDEYAARDPRVTAVHLAHNLGAGPARNAGLARATGDYLVFLDGDDTLAPDALRAVADRLKDTGSPDVLVYDHARLLWTGDTARNPLAHLLVEDGPASFRPADRPALLGLPAAAWNKACRRDYVEREGLSFPTGLYEDVAWSCRALLAAESVAVLDRVCVYDRQRRTGSLRTTTTRRHLDVLDQYERVFGLIATRPGLERWRPAVHRRTAGHLCALYAEPHRLPRAARAEFFARASALLRRHRPAGPAPLPLSLPRADRIRHTLMRLGLRRTYGALAALDPVGAAAARAGTALWRGLRETSLRLHYRLQRLLPLRRELAVFSAYWHGGYACNPAAIEAKLRELAPRMRTAWICDPRHAATLPPRTALLRPGSAAYWSALARAAYLTTNVNFDRGLVKRRGQVLLQTQHGTPLKRVGLDLQDRPAAAPTADFEGLLRGADQWDYLLSANRHSTLVWQRAVPAAYTTLEYGYPRNDAFHRATGEDVAELRERLGIPAGSTAVLYAPTHRDYRRSRPEHLDFERVLRDLGPRFTILVRRHLTYADTGAGAGGERVRHPRLIDVSAHPSVEELCLAADALVTDYSSLMFDYAALDRPIVIHADDWEAYEAARGTYFDLRSCPPGAIARTEDELVDIFTTGHWQGSRSAQLRAAFRARFCQFDDGHAAERVVRRVFLGEPSPVPPVVPLADRRAAPAPSSRTPEPALAPLTTRAVWP